MRVKFGVLEHTRGLHLRAKFHLNVFIVSPSSGQKPQFWANLTFWGLLYRPSFSDEGQIWDYVPNFVSIGLFCHPLAAKNPNFCRFLEFGI